jgi:hypothetical protein
VKTGSARRLQTTGDDNLMHPPCTPESEVSVDVPMTLAR